MLLLLLHDILGIKIQVNNQNSTSEPLEREDAGCFPSPDQPPLHHRPSAPRHPIIYHSLGGDFTPAFTCLVLNNRTKCTKFTCDQHCCQLYLHVSSARSSLRHSIHFVCYKNHLGSLTPYHYYTMPPCNITSIMECSYVQGTPFFILL